MIMSDNIIELSNNEVSLVIFRIWKHHRTTPPLQASTAVLGVNAEGVALRESYLLPSLPFRSSAQPSPLEAPLQRHHRRRRRAHGEGHTVTV